MIGNSLSHYKILEKIGEGGMGEVYLAEDTKLSRPVALKVLPSEMAANDSRRERFEREAKAVAALNHPNIVTVHSVEQDGGVHFITMELVRGRNLSQLIPDKGLPLKRFLEIAIPLADAVAAAHRAGITHRDLKPDNVMVTDDDRVKVLDFGLAKPEAGFALGNEGSEVRTQARTREGEIVGTPSYMSPEQAEGKAVDPRSDIFSLGILFYEMLAGRRPFTGDTAAAVLSSIMKDQPPPLEEVRSQVPAPLSKMAQRCLAKDPERRSQSAADLHKELQELRTEPATGRSAQSWLGAAVVLSIAVGMWTYLTRTEDTVLRLANPQQLTSAIGVEDYPSWSPDGRTVAYATQTVNLESGNFDIWVTQIGSDETVNRTSDHPGLDNAPAFSPDGGQIAFWSDRDGGGYYVMSALGGAARRVVPGGQFRGRPQWSADGEELACVVTKESGSVAEIVSLATGQTRLVPLPGEEHQRADLSWSPDGRFFSYVDPTSGASTAHRVWVTRVEDGKGVPVTEASTEDWSPSWSPDGRTLFYVSNRGGSMDLWQQRIGEDGMADGEPEPITSGLVMRRAAMSPDGTKLAYSKGRRIANIWRVPLLSERPAGWADAEQITFDQALIEFVDVSPEGERILFSSDRSGNHDIWMMRLEGGDLLQVTRDPAGDWNPRWSPDGLSVVFYSQRSGNRDIWVKQLDAGPARQVTRHEVDDYWPSWSPDGEKVAFASARDGNARQLFVVSIDGGNASRITEGFGVSASDWSRDGSQLVFSSGGQVFLIDTEAGAARRLVLGSGGWSRWSRDGKHIYFQGADERADNIWEVQPDGKGVRPLTDLVGRPGRPGYEAPTTDGEYLYFIWVEDLGDIWVMDVVENL